MPSYYKIVAFGAPDSAVKATPEEAWESWWRLTCREFPLYGPPDAGRCNFGTAVAAHSARLIRRETRQAARDADISDSW